MSVRTYRDLIAWQQAIGLVKRTYEVTQTWPNEEKFGLTSQIRRAVVSIPSCIAEGHGRRSEKELVRFLNIAHGSLMEVETQLTIARELTYISATNVYQLHEMSDQLGRTIYGLLQCASAKN